MDNKLEKKVFDWVKVERNNLSNFKEANDNIRGSLAIISFQYAS